MRIPIVFYLRGCSTLALGVLIASPVAADVEYVQNVAFNAAKVNPYSGDAGFELEDAFRLYSQPLESPKLQLLNINPTGGFLEGLLGIELPSVVRLKAAVGVFGSNNLDFGYYVNGGHLNISYPAANKLNFQTYQGNDYVRANRSFTIGTTFQPGVTQRGIPPAVVTGPIGYTTLGTIDLGGTSLSGVSFTEYSTPAFATVSPYAQAWLHAGVDIRAGLTTKVELLGGLFEFSKDFTIGGNVGGRIVEVDPSGLYVGGIQQGNFSLTEPIPINIPGIGAGTISVPSLAVVSGPPTGAVLTAHVSKPILTVDADLEKLIPTVGPLLSNSLGPIDYTLLHLGGGPVVGLYQDMNFTPDPKVRLQFSEPVLVNNQAVIETEFPLGQQINWEPMFSNSSEIIISPTYILNNTFTNEMGIDLSVQVHVEALKLEILGLTAGPLLDKTVTVPIVKSPPLISRDFQIPLGTVTADRITIQKANHDQVMGLGDIKVTSLNYVEGDPNGIITYDFNFVRSVDGGTPRNYQALAVSGNSTTVHYTPPGGSDALSYAYFQSQQDIIVVDPVTSEQINLGRDFCLGSCNLSALLPDSSPGYFDPALPDLGMLSVSAFPDLPDTFIDVEKHAILGQYNPDDTNVSYEETFPTETLDRRAQPSTTILARTREFVPEGYGEYTGFNDTPVINAAGEVIFNASFQPFGGPPANYGFFQHSGTEGRTVATGAEIASSFSLGLNDSGQALFSTGTAIVRTEPEGGASLIAQSGQPAPDGNGSFQSVHAHSINDLGQVAFVAVLTGALPTTDLGVYVGGNGAIEKIVRSGDTLPGVTGTVESAFSPSINNAGEAAFTVIMNDGKIGTFFKSGGTTTPIAVTGDAAPQDAQFLNPGWPLLNESGQVAFRSQVQLSGGAEFPIGIYLADGQQISQIIREGDTAPAQDGVIHRFVNITQLSDSGQVVIPAEVRSSGAGYDALFLGEASGLTEIARRGHPVPDGNGTFPMGESLTTVSLNNAGQIAFATYLENTSGLDDYYGIFIYDGANFVQVARMGQPLAGSTVAELKLTNFNGPDQVLNDNMQLVYQATLADGRQVVARFEPSNYWRNTGNGNWNSAGNWSLGVAPSNPYDMFIIAENALMVTGPTSNHTVKSLTLGGEHSAAATLNLTGGVTLAVSRGTTIRPNGILAGYGALTGDVTSNGTIRVGDAGAAPTTAMVVDGDLALEAGSILEVDIRSNSLVDQLAVIGAATVGGELAASLVAFSPTLGNTFNILGAIGGLSGQFDMTITDLPDLSPGLGWLVNYNPTSVALQVVVETVGDFSSNGVVGPEDYLVWKANYGSTENLAADANGNGIVDAADYTVWRNRLGSGAGSIAGQIANSTAPEPSTFVALVIAISITTAIGGRRYARSPGTRWAGTTPVSF